VSKEPKLPTGWVFSTIGEVCEPSQYGYTAKASSSGRTHYLRTTDITSGLINWASVPYCDIPENEEPKYLLNDGDVVISRAGSVGFSCLILNPAKSVFASYLIRFRPLILPKYFSYFLNTPAYWESIGERSLGIAVQNVNATNLSEIQIPIAPKAEQSRLVEKLEELFSDLDAGVAELKAAQKKLAQYRQSLLKAAVEGSLTAEWRAKNTPKETGAQLLERILKERRTRWEEKQLAKFKEQGKTPPKGWQDKYPEPVQPDTTNLPELPEGWVWASLDQLTEFITSGSRGWADYYSNEGALFIRSQNINKDWLDLSDIAFVQPPKSSEGARTRVKANDLLLTITGAKVGKSAQVINDLEEAYVSQHVALIRLVNITLASYAHLFLTSDTGGRGQLNKEAYGAGKPGLNLQQVAAVSIPLPCIDELSKLIGIVEFQLQSISDTMTNIQQSLTQAAAQRKNILKSAFSGQLVPQDPNDEPASLLLERIRAERQKQASTLTRGRKRLNLIKSNKYVMR
jgi:type I restriction enzyme, S subunit